MQEEVIAVNENTVVFNKLGGDSIYSLEENEIVLIVQTDDIAPGWVFIELPEHNLTKSTIENSPPCISGYVRKSDILSVEKLQSPSRNEISLEFNTKKTDSPPMHHVGVISTYYASELTVVFNGKRISQDEIYFKYLHNYSFKLGLYSSANNEKFKTFKINQTYIIKQKCGDGSEFYEISWRIKNGIIVQRIIDEI